MTDVLLGLINVIWHLCIGVPVCKISFMCTLRSFRLQTTSTIARMLNKLLTRMCDNTFFKFADDTYFVIPTTKASTCTRASEIDNIVAWAADSNLSLNKSKSTEVLFHDNSRGKLKTLPPPLSDITQETSLKILGVTFRNNLSASDHIRNVVSESAKTLYALRVLRYHGLSDAGLQEVFHAVVISRLTYASTAWSKFVTATDIQRVDAFLRRSKRCGFCPPGLPDFGDQLAEFDDRLFSRISRNPQHVLYRLLPPPSVASQNYDL